MITRVGNRHTYLTTLTWASLLAVSGGSSRCGSRPATTPNSVGEDLRVQLEKRAGAIRSWAATCDGVPLECDDGDGVAHAGLLCLSGEKASCEFVRRSVDASGRGWRNPSRIGRDPSDSFSRDQYFGLLMTIAATEDRDLAERHERYTDSIGGRLCPDASDSRCDHTVVTRGLSCRVWRAVGLSCSVQNTVATSIDSFTIALQTATVPIGYQLELNVEAVQIARAAGYEDDYIKDAAKTAYERQPANPYFRFVHLGADDEVARLYLEQAPATKPEFPDRWSIAKDTAGAEWTRSLGWEFIFLYNLMRGVQ